jgi:hypothetical protein
VAAARVWAVAAVALEREREERRVAARREKREGEE